MVKKGPVTKGPSERARRRFLDAGLEVLGEQGHAGLKLAQVCTAADATTGSFYHAFGNWAEFTSALIAHWRDEHSRRLIGDALAVPDPRVRLDVLIEIGLALDRRSEAAIRVWSTHDPVVLETLRDVDRERTEVIAETAAAVLGDEQAAQSYAQAALYLLIGYQLGTVESLDALRYGFDSMLKQSLADHPTSA